MADKLVTLLVTGKSHLLMHSPASMFQERGGRGSSIPTPEAEAEMSLYLDDNGGVVAPTIGIRNGIIKASAVFKATRGRGSMKSALSHIYCPDEFTPLLKLDGTQYRKGEHTIDRRRAVVQKAGILRSRAKFTAWCLKVAIVFDDELIKSADLIVEIAKDAGRRMGFLDYRPEKTGWFGKYTVELVSVEDWNE